MRSLDDYLSLYPKRDVIEFPLDAVLDVNGWDLAKALRLLLKGNAVVIEWLTSPFIYAGDETFREEACRLAGNVARAPLVARHYLHLGERQRRVYFADARSVPLKKIFYALRPAAALRWLRLHPSRAVAPMHFQTLVAESDLPENVLAIIEELLARKAETHELGSGALPEPVGRFIDSEFEAARMVWAETGHAASPAAREEADIFFRRWVAG